MRGILRRTWAVLTERPGYRPPPYDATDLRRGTNSILLVFAGTVAATVPAVLALVLTGVLAGALALSLVLACCIAVVEGAGGVQR